MLLFPQGPPFLLFCWAGLWPPSPLTGRSCRLPVPGLVLACRPSLLAVSSFWTLFFWNSLPPSSSGEVCIYACVLPVSSFWPSLVVGPAVTSYCSPRRAGFMGLGDLTAQLALLCLSLSLFATREGKEREAGVGRQGFLEMEGQSSEAGRVPSTTWPNRASGIAVSALSWRPFQRPKSSFFQPHPLREQGSWGWCPVLPGAAWPLSPS